MRAALAGRAGAAGWARGAGRAGAAGRPPRPGRLLEQGGRAVRVDDLHGGEHLGDVLVGPGRRRRISRGTGVELVGRVAVALPARGQADQDRVVAASPWRLSRGYVPFQGERDVREQPGEPAQGLAVRGIRHQGHRDHQPDDQRVRHDPPPLPPPEPAFPQRRVRDGLDHAVAEVALQFAQRPAPPASRRVPAAGNSAGRLATAKSGTRECTRDSWYEARIRHPTPTRSPSSCRTPKNHPHIRQNTFGMADRSAAVVMA